MLEGFTTDLPLIVRQFKHELDMCRNAMDKILAADAPCLVRDYFFRTFASLGMTSPLRSSLEAFMAADESTFC